MPFHLHRPPVAERAGLRRSVAPPTDVLFRNAVCVYRSEWTVLTSGSKLVRCFFEGDRMCHSIYTDRRSRSEPAYVDPSLRRRMSCSVTLIACIDETSGRLEYPIRNRNCNLHRSPKCNPNRCRIDALLKCFGMTNLRTARFPMKPLFQRF